MGVQTNKQIDIQDELAQELLPIIADKDTYVGTMLMLTVNQPDPDGNCRKLLEFIRANPSVGYDEVIDKADEIVGLENPFTDDD